MQGSSGNADVCNYEVHKSAKELGSQSHAKHSKMCNLMNGSVSPESSIRSANSWSHLFNRLTKDSFEKKPKIVAGEAPGKHSRSERGLLVSYSASRQCGFIYTDNELEVLVIQEELLRAGVPENLLVRSCNNIGHNVKFDLNILSSEPIVTFEATNLKFTNFFLK